MTRACVADAARRGWRPAGRATILSAMETSPAAPEPQATSPGAPFAPFTTVAGDPASGLVIVCDHADNRVPPEYADLGLPPAEFRRHIAWDPGAAAVTRSLAEALGAPAVLSTFSRLLIDANRGEDDPTLIMRLSDGAVVPRNAKVDAAIGLTAALLFDHIPLTAKGFAQQKFKLLPT